MPEPYDTLEDYILPGFPQENTTDTTFGHTWHYRAPSSVVAANKPAASSPWIDGFNVSSILSFEHDAATGYSDLVVSTAVSVSYSGVIGTPALEKTHYEIDHKPVVKPLEVHPDFLEGGDYELTDDDRKDILGWRAELDPALRSTFKYKPLDSSGEPGGETEITSESALAFIGLLRIGVEEYVDYLPIWAKRSIYLGSVAPPKSAIGGIETPSGSPPSGYQWVKSKDRGERIGLSSRWRRDEEWEGAVTVYADAISVYPP